MGTCLSLSLSGCALSEIWSITNFNVKLFAWMAQVPCADRREMEHHLRLILSPCLSLKAIAAHADDQILTPQVIHTVQRAERGLRTQASAHPDMAVWNERLRSLSATRLCPIVPGEVAPYPSCSSS